PARAFRLPSSTCLSHYERDLQIPYRGQNLARVLLGMLYSKGIFMVAHSQIQPSLSAPRRTQGKRCLKICAPETPARKSCATGSFSEPQAQTQPLKPSLRKGSNNELT